MFSLTETIRKKRTIKTVSINQLIDNIKHDKNDKIDKLHSLDKTVDKEDYDKIKQSLPCITPHGTFTKAQNDCLINLSGYLYFDIDEDVTRQELINKYNDIATLIGHSVGGKSWFVLVKLEDAEKLNAENFNSVFNWIRKIIFKQKTDNNAKGLSRQFIIPSDPDLYVNHKVNLSNIPDEVFAKKQPVASKTKKESKNKLTICKNEKYNQLLQAFFHTNKTPLQLSTDNDYLPLNELLNKYSFATQVVIDEDVNDDYIIAPVDYIKLRFPRIIKDGTKHKTFSNLVNIFVHLNPDASLHATTSYIHHINKHFTGESPMEEQHLKEYVRYKFNQSKERGLWVPLRTRHIHWPPNCKFSAIEKNAIANKANGNIRKEKTLKKLISVIDQMLATNKPINQKSIAETAGISRATINAKWKDIKAHYIQQGIELNYTHQRQSIAPKNKVLNNIKEIVKLSKPRETKQASIIRIVTPELKIVHINKDLKTNKKRLHNKLRIA